MLFSVLIPVYNAQNFIGETLESILKQTLQDFEIVIMDDSSTDNSAEICREFAEKHKGKIRFYQQENKGVLLARRDLAFLAKGEYLVFVDSDDFLSENALGLLKDTIVKNDPDVVLYDILKKSSSKDEMYTIPLDNDSIFTGESKKEIRRMLLLTKYIYSMCQKAIRRECFDFEADYREYRGMRIGEDAFQSFPIMDKAEKIVYLKEPIYIYRKNESSATAKIYVDDIRWHKMHFKREDEYIEKWNIDDEDVKRVYEIRIRKILSFVSLIIKRKEATVNYRQFRQLLKETVNDELFLKAVKKADRERLQIIYKLDLLLIKLKLYWLLYIEKHLI